MHKSIHECFLTYAHLYVLSEMILKYEFIVLDMYFV